MKIIHYTPENLRAELKAQDLSQALISYDTGLSESTVMRACSNGANPLLANLILIGNRIGAQWLINPEGRYRIDYNDAALKDIMDLYSRDLRRYRHNQSKIHRETGLARITVTKLLERDVETLQLKSFECFAVYLGIGFLLDPELASTAGGEAEDAADVDTAA